MKRFACVGAALVIAWAVLGVGGARADANADYAKALRAVAAQLRAVAASVRPSVGRTATFGRTLQVRQTQSSPLLEDWLRAQLATVARMKPAKRAAALRTIAVTLEDAAALTVAAKPAAPALNPKRTVLAILADPSYRLTELSKTVEKTWWERFLEWLGGIIDRLFGGAIKAAASAPRLSQVLGIAILVAVAAALAFIIYQLARGYLVTRPRRAIEDSGEVIGPAVNPQSLVSAAIEAARAGRYARAVALLFQASLVGLDRAGVVTYDPARTAGEYRRVVKRSRAGAAPSFDRLAFAFTYATYAERPTGETEWQDAQSAYHAFVPFVGSGSAAAGADA